MSPNMAGKVIRYFQEPPMRVGALSEREMQVLDLLSHGLMYKEIAAKRKISLNTVQQHVAAIYSKLNVHSRAHATRHYLQPPTA